MEVIEIKENKNHFKKLVTTLDKPKLRIHDSLKNLPSLKWESKGDKYK